MIWVAISSSSPKVSCAIFREKHLLSNLEHFAPRAASEAGLQALKECIENAEVKLSDVQGFAADIGPGSFTGIKVCVMIAKTLAYSLSAPCAGIPAWDLIDPNKATAIPVRKNQYLIREPGTVPLLLNANEANVENLVGYGELFAQQHYPDAQNAVQSFERLKWVSAIELLPEYVLEPSISQPKKPFGVS